MSLFDGKAKPKQILSLLSAKAVLIFDLTPKAPKHVDLKFISANFQYVFYSSYYILRTLRSKNGNTDKTVYY